MYLELDYEKQLFASAYLSEIESVRKEPPFKTLQKICLALDISLAEFFADGNQAKPGVHQAKATAGHQ
jgi:transcriptional regulator with XRE-family HTH domain